MRKDGETFVLPTVVSSSAEWTPASVQNMITGDVFEVVEAEQTPWRTSGAST